MNPLKLHLKKKKNFGLSGIRRIVLLNNDIIITLRHVDRQRFLTPPPLCLLQLSPGSEEDDHEGPVQEKLGRIQFSVGYSFQDSTLTVKILRGQELPAKDFSGTSDPFVKLYLLPDKKHKLETKVKRKNLNPHWNETFLFEGKVGGGGGGGGKGFFLKHTRRFVCH